MFISLGVAPQYEYLHNTRVSISRAAPPMAAHLLHAKALTCSEQPRCVKRKRILSEQRTISLILKMNLQLLHYDTAKRVIWQCWR
jgi:hypothetical protein